MVDLTNPTKIKELPLYGANLTVPFKIQSDSNFLYVLMTNNVLNVYKPSASQHETLYRQYNYSDVSLEDDIVVSSTSAGLFSYLLIGYGKEFKNLKLYINPTMTIVPGSYNNGYFTQVNYTLKVTNTLGSVPIIITHNMNVFNS